MQNNGYLLNKLINIDEKEIYSDLNLHPRPGFKRDEYLSLNGERDVKITKDKEDKEEFKNKIIVPFAVESPLSKVNHLLEPDEYIIYRKRITIDNLKKYAHVIFNFEGIDQIAEIYINGKFVLKHIGGYTRFKFDAYPFLEKENEIIIKVKDVTDTSYYLRGKQTLNPSGWFYSSSSGIYKSAYIEFIKSDYITDIKYVEDFDNQGFSILLKSSSGEGKAKVYVNDEIFNVKINEVTKIKPKVFIPWDINNPYLYNIKIEYKKDVVYSYFGIRKIETKLDGTNKRIFLNNKRVILNGLLDQGYYDLGGLTPRSYSDYENDVRNIKELGFNTIRKHIKVEEDMFYYYCDKYGILVIQDIPNGGTRYKFLNVVFPRLSIKLFNKEAFCTYKRYGREDVTGRSLFISEAKKIIDMTNNFPSVIIYTIFNEAWGEFDPSSVYKIFKEYNREHLYDTASGWLDSKNSDFFSIHSYTLPGIKRKSKDGRPYVLTEIGGYAYAKKEHYYFNRVFGHKATDKKDKLVLMYKKLYKKMINLMKTSELNGVIYTQLADCETEANGLYTSDRKVLKIDKKVIQDINKEIDDLYKNS